MNASKLIFPCYWTEDYPKDWLFIHVCIIHSLEFSLARFGVTLANNSAIDIYLVGEGFPAAGIEQTESGALECHTDDTTCCRGVDNPNGGSRGEWYYPDGTLVPPPGVGPDRGYVSYRTRDHMVIRLNIVPIRFQPTGVYRCVIPGAGGVIITRNIQLERQCK